MQRRRRALDMALSLLCATAFLLLAPASAAGCANDTLQPDATNVVEIRTATRCLINGQRKPH